MSDDILECEQAADCLLPMGITSAFRFVPCSFRPNCSPACHAGENVATEYKVSREAQDEFAAESFRRAAAAQKAGKFKDEIVPVKVKWTDPKTEEEKEITVSQDDGIREGVTKESLSKLKPVFSKTGSTHAGNASQVRSRSPYRFRRTVIDLFLSLPPPRRSRTAPRQSSSPAAPRQKNLASRSSPSSPARPSPASSPSSWVSVRRLRSPRCSRRRESRRMRSTCTS